MTFYEFGFKELTSRGLFGNQAAEVMLKEMETNNLMDNRWGEDISEYPPMMKTLLWMGIESKALEYIKENCPEAWFRPIFDIEHPLRKQFEASQKKISK